jgi:AcrR family transcriptional regulator
MGRRPRVTRAEVFAAVRAAFGESGYEGTTLAAIAARLGVSPAALFRHAPTKEALFGAAFASGASLAAMPMEFLEALDGTEDPIPVLRKVGERLVPVLEATLAETIVSSLHARRGGTVSIPLPFDPRSRSTPPQRVFAALERYFTKAKRKGRVRVADPRAAATAFQGALFAYVSFHRLFRILDPPLPLERYLETLTGIWENGAIARPRLPRRRTR